MKMMLDRLLCFKSGLSEHFWDQPAEPASPQLIYYILYIYIYIYEKATHSPPYILFDPTTYIQYDS